MERHAALPEAEEAERIVEEMVRLIEDRVADPSADDDADHQPEQEVVDIDAGEGAGLSAPQPIVGHQPPRIPPADQDAGEVGKSVPADREWAER